MDQGSAVAQATHVYYDLHSLGWKAFQDLCATVARDVWGQSIQVFSDTNDGGRDGAFAGTWEGPDGAKRSGTFAIQCKFTVDRDKSLSVSDLKSEVSKAKRLATAGLADNYLLFTNAKITGRNAERIRAAFLAAPGVKEVTIFGHEGISGLIRESAKLRTLVPRLYGLGDLSQILDERAYSQAQAILSQLGDGLRTFVITEAYRDSAKALSEHGFVLLLGEPACGKSTIASMLAVGALDLLKCRTLKVLNAEEFRNHWNPKDPKQLFWVDDAFGVTQFEWESALGWCRAFGLVQTAINSGARFVFTSRDYIFKSAKRVLKTSALPALDESRVVIQVEKLSQEEREKILYNHVRLGKQPRDYKTSVKPFLPDVAAHPRFSPETARRLGNPFFTKGLNPSKYGLESFVANPIDQLRETIRTLDFNSRAALALLFVNGGALPCPLRLSENDMRAITVMGGDLAGVGMAIDALDGSLLVKSLDGGGDHTWRFKHPTIGEAFSSEIGENAAFMDIYLAGAKLENVFREVSCGDLGIEGVKLVVPRSRNAELISRMREPGKQDWSERHATANFLANRCDRSFFMDLLAKRPDYADGLQLGSQLRYCPSARVLSKMRSLGVLEEDRRLRFVERIKVQAVETPDSGFLSDYVRPILTESEVRETLTAIEAEVVPRLATLVAETRQSHDGEGDPEEHFDELKSALESFRDEFGESSDPGKRFGAALDLITDAVSDLKEAMDKKLSARDDDRDFDVDERGDDGPSTRSIFEDVDA